MAVGVVSPEEFEALVNMDALVRACDLDESRLTITKTFDSHMQKHALFSLTYLTPGGVRQVTIDVPSAPLDPGSWATVNGKQLPWAEAVALVRTILKEEKHG